MSGLPTDFDVSSLESEFAKFGIYGIKAVASDEEDGKAEKSVSVTYSSKTEAAEAAKVSSMETDKQIGQPRPACMDIFLSGRF